MRRFTIFALFIFCILSIMIFAWAKQSNAPDLLSQIRSQHPFSSTDMQWKSLTRTLSSDGLVFYQPRFPKLPIRAQADRLTLKSSPSTLSFRFSSGVIDAAQTLLSAGPTATLEQIKNFREPMDFLRHPLTALVLLNHDVLKGNMEITLKYQGNRATLALHLWHNKGEILTLRTTLSDIPNNHLWGWLDGTFQSAQIQVDDAQLLQSVAGYLSAIEQPIPPALHHALGQHIPFQTLVRFPEPHTISSLFF